MSEPINEAGNIPVSAPTPVVSVSSVVLSAPGRAVDLQMRVSAPVIRKRAAGHPSLARPWPCEQSFLTERLRPARQLLGGARLRRDPADPSGLEDAAPRSR